MPPTVPFRGMVRGDPIIGTHRSAICTVIERKCRATLLVHLPRLADYGAEAMNATLTASMTTLPAQLRQTPTWDRGKELSSQALAAAHERERRRANAPALPEGHRPLPADRR